MTEDEHPQMTPEQSAKLLELLSSDDEFRSLFSTDPVAALGKIGVECRGDPPVCASVKVLASKEELSAARGRLLKYMQTTDNLKPHHVFEAGMVASTLDGL